MKIQLVILVTSIIAFEAIAQVTNTTALRHNADAISANTNSNQPALPNIQMRKKLNSERHNQQTERKLQLMKRALNRIGITEEEQKQVIELQKAHKEKMKINMQRIGDARKELSKLQDEGADEEALENAIQKITEAQSEQLRVLVKNRMEMERILGKEKYARFMENARTAFRKHGRHGGRHIPPRPGWPPFPGQKNTPPPPPSGSPSKPNEEPPPPPSI